LAAAGARRVLGAASTGADADYAVQRLARRLSRPQQEQVVAQAIDAANDMAVRVMVRQAAKALAGLDALFFCADLGAATAEALALACRHGSREMRRTGGGAIVVVGGTEIGPLVGECLAAGAGRRAGAGGGGGERLAGAARRLAGTGEAGAVLRAGED